MANENFYDRDPKTMVRYAKEANQLIAEMTGIVASVSKALEANSAYLDDASQKDVEKLKTCVVEFKKQMQTYQNITAMITDKAKKAMFRKY